MNKLNTIFSAVLLLCALACFGATVNAQTTAFTYQGRFTDATVAQPTNGTYQMQFKVYDQAQTGTGSQIENTVTIPAVQVVNGIFTVQLDFGARAFNSGDRFIEISVQPTGGSGYTTLAPRQQVTNAPFAIRSLSADFAAAASNAVKLGGVLAGNYTQNTDARLSDDRNPTAGSGNYIQNTSAQQANADFNVSGNGTAGGTLSGNAVNTQTYYKIGGTAVLSSPSQTTVAVGQSSNHTLSLGGADSTYVGYNTGHFANISSSANTFVGSQAGASNTSGKENSFFGKDAGKATTNAGRNAFFGYQAGMSNLSGNSNSFFGYQAGQTSTGGQNTVIGAYSDVAADANNNSLLGVFSIVYGDENAAVGVQTTSNGNGNSMLGTKSIIFGNYNTLLGYHTNGANNVVNHSTAIGAEAVVTTDNTIVLGTNAETTKIPGALSVTGKTQIFSLGAPGSTSLCRNAANQISTCTAGNFAEKDQSQIAALNQQNLELKTQIERQQQRIAEQEENTKQLKLQFDALRKIVCAASSTAAVCAR